MSEEVLMAEDFVKDEVSSQKGKVSVRTRVIDVDRDKNNFIGDIHSFSALMEQKIRSRIIDSGECDDSDLHVRVVMTFSLPQSARAFSPGIETFKNMSMRAAISTKRANVTSAITRDSYMREKDDEIKQKLLVNSVPFRDAKCVMEARVDNGAVLLEFRPIHSLAMSKEICVKKNSGWDWNQLLDFLADEVVEAFGKEMQVYDLICVFRNVAFETVADVLSEG